MKACSGACSGRGIGRGQMVRLRREKANNEQLEVCPGGKVMEDQEFGGGEKFEDEEEIKCTICLGPMVKAAGLNVCQHVFCLICIYQASFRKNTCPLCRKRYRYIMNGEKQIYCRDTGGQDDNHIHGFRPNVEDTARQVYGYLEDRWNEVIRAGKKLWQLKRTNITFGRFELAPCDKGQFSKELHRLLQSYWTKNKSQLKNLGLLSEKHFNPQVRLDTSAEIANVVIEDVKRIMIVKGRQCDADECNICYD